MKNLLLLAMMGVCSAVNAITVSITVLEDPLCAYPTGYLSANANGGVGPYNYLWSTGATTSSIQNVPAGSYSVTVTDANSDHATAEIELDPVDYSDFNYSVGQIRPYCVDEFPFSSFFIIDPTGPGISWGPPPYSFNGQPLNLVDPNWPDLGYLATVPGTPGVPYYATFQDGNGCTGEWLVTPVGPVDWPGLGILDIQSSCANFPTGSVTISHSMGNSTYIGHTVENLTTQTLIIGPGTGEYYEYPFTSGTFVYDELPPGDYRLRQRIMPLWNSAGCYDELLFTIPDLGPTCGKVQGLAFVDYNQNCTKQTNEPGAPGQIIEVLPGPYYATTNSSGAYELVLPFGEYTLTQQSDVLAEHCTGGPIPFTISASPNIVTRNLPDTSLVPLDVQAMLSSGIARPGFEFNYVINVRNLTPVVSGATTVTFTFDPTLTYVSSTPNPSNVSGNTITWNQAQLTAWQQRNYTIHFQVPPDIGLLGYELIATAEVSTANTDGNLDNNTATNYRTITGAYDPNDKLATTSSGNTDVWQLGADEWIDYTIRFQNTGTDTAFNVVITDTLPSNLDPGSIIMGASSHTFTWELRDQGTLKFYYPNILLPDSNINEPLSHGFVGFRIRPHLPLLPGDQITNIANIYFDFNPPVITDPSVLVVPVPTVTIQVKSFLAGPYDPNTGLMHDQLRTGGWLPLNEPYSGLGYSHVGGGGSESTTMAVLAVTGSQSIVDWVVVELHHPSTPSQVLHTRSALIRRDGQVVDVDGVSPVGFNAPAGNYHVAVKHRNHLGCMTATAVALGTTSSLMDLSSSATSVWGSQARINISGTMALWPGDVNFDGVVKYTGAGNDRDPILVAIGGSVPTNTVMSYDGGDVNMDGTLKYTGFENDRDIILQTIGGTVPTNVRVEQVP